ncbi:MAG: AraC family transcriptional regulator [Flavobacteriales bacterium]|nr:AraC family transcriptional regulator [Flavobacteriales bacterium]
MTTDIVEINDFIVLIDTTDALEAEVVQCQFDTDIMGISFYGSGKVEIEVTYGTNQQSLKSQKGMAFSCIGNDSVRFSHKILQAEPLKSISIFSKLKNLQKLPPYEKELFNTHLGDLLSTNKEFELGPQVLMTPEMQNAISKIFTTQLQGPERLLFLKSQILELLSHYFAQIGSSEKQPPISPVEIQQMYQAKEIMIQNMDKPPSLSELSKLIGTNNNKLKRNFKQLFGVPVFKYLQHQRLLKAYQLLEQKEMNVQEVADFVGYESLSSFSNAFFKQYGFRPSEVTK